MNNPPQFPRAAETAASGAAVPNHTSLTPGVQETPVDPATEFGLTPTQMIAYEVLTSGQRAQDAAERAGVDIHTIWHWRSSDPNFTAAMEAWRQRTRAKIRLQMQEIARMAYEKSGELYERKRAAKKKRRASRKDV